LKLLSTTGHRIQTLLDELGWTLERLSSESGVPYRTAENHVRGNSKSARRGTLAALSQTFSRALKRRVSIDWLQGKN
jgi:hypothetical protein